MREPFRLLPWERGGHPVKPSQQMTAFVEGRTRRFDVKTHGNRIYFRLADEQERDERIWTLPTPSPAHNQESFFQREVEASRVARFFCIKRTFSTTTVTAKFHAELWERFHPSNLSMLGPTSIAVAITPSGHVFAQEWCGGSWFEYDLPPRTAPTNSRPPSIWHRAWNAKNLRRSLASMAGPIALRPFALDLAEEPLLFATGSHQQLENLIHAANTYFVPDYMKLSLLARSAYSYGPRDNGLLQYHIHIHAESQNAKSHCYQTWDIVPCRLLDLFIEYNLPIGGQWRAHRYQRSDFERNILDTDEEDDDELTPTEQLPPPEPVLRVDFGFTPHAVTITGHVPREPSAHERMEAYLTLRDWLRDKASSTQIDRLLTWTL